MEEPIRRLRNRFTTLPNNLFKKIYDCRLEIMKIVMHLRLLKDVRWIIESKVRLAGEIHKSFVRSMLEIGRSSYSKKRRAKKMKATISM